MWIPRVGRLFNEQALPLSIALNAAFPEEHPDVWQQFRSMVPKALIIAHGKRTLCWREMDSNPRSPGHGELCCRALRPFGVGAVSRAPPQRA
jgi:hypothetical protein